MPLKNVLPWLAIGAIVLTLFLLPQVPGKRPGGLTPRQAWDRGIALLSAESSDETGEAQAQELLESVPAFRSPEQLDAETATLLQEVQAAQGEARYRLARTLLQAAQAAGAMR